MTVWRRSSRDDSGSRIVGFEANKKYVGQNSNEILDHVIPADLIEYGLIPEMVGRLPVVAPLRPLDEAAMLSILTEPKNALTKQYMQAAGDGRGKAPL